MASVIFTLLVGLRQDGRALTPSPCRSSRAASGSPISPPSTSSLTSSPPPVYAESDFDHEGWPPLSFLFILLLLKISKQWCWHDVHKALGNRIGGPEFKSYL